MLTSKFKIAKMVATTFNRGLHIVVIHMVLLFLSYPLLSQQYIADYTVANEEVLRSIPVAYINKAKAELVVAYQHTSHGTHVSRGMFGLQGYKQGDDVLFGISPVSAQNMLEFRDFAMVDYAPAGVDGSDLSRDETAFIQTTRNYLDAPENATVNVVMWAWSRIAGHNVAGNYLPGMETLINEYGPGGSKIGSGAAQREEEHNIKNIDCRYHDYVSTGLLNPKEQAELIVNYCKTNQLFCHEYYTIDTYTMDDTYYEDTGDNGDSDTYGGNFYEGWQNSHTLGVDYYENWHTPAGHVSFGTHTTQHITSNRKAYAMWWILARIAGWSGITSDEASIEVSDDLLIYPNPGSGRFFIENDQDNMEYISVVDGLGREVQSLRAEEASSPLSIDLSGNSPGIYSVMVSDSEYKIQQSKVLLLK